MTQNQTEFNNGKQTFNIDTSSLEEEDGCCATKEVYHQLENADHYRIGVSVISSSDGSQAHNIEFLLCALQRKSKVEPHLLEQALKISNVLLNKGYSVIHQDDGWLICEKQVKPREVKFEIHFLKDLVSKFEDSYK